MEAIIVFLCILLITFGVFTAGWRLGAEGVFEENIVCDKVGKAVECNYADK